jgi:hypothetical protein
MAADLVSQATSAVQNAVQTASTLTGPNGAMKGLASNAFIATAKDNLAVKDVYTGVDGKSILSSVENLFDGIDLSFTDVLRGGKWLANNVPTISSLTKQGLAVFSAKGLTARILGSSNLATSLFGKLSSSGQSGLLGMFSDNKQLFASVNGLVQRVASTDLTNISAVGGLLNQVTGNTSLFSLDDKDSQVGLFAGIIHDATSFGIPNSFGALTSKITDTNLLGQIANKVLPSVLNSSDVSSLLSIGQALGNKNALALNPSLISEFSFKYVLPALSTNADGSIALDKVLGAFNAVDSDWNVCTRNTTLPDGSTQESTGVNVSSIIGASDDFTGIFTQGAKKSDDPNVQVMQLATLFGPTTVTSTLQSSYPQTLFQSNTIANVSATDPTLLGSNSELAELSNNTDLW